MTVRTESENFVRDGAHSSWLYSRNAAREICKMLAGSGYQLLGLEGFEVLENGHRPDSTTIWTRNLTAKLASEADVINLQAIESIDEDPPHITAYMLTAARFPKRS